MISEHLVKWRQAAFSHWIVCVRACVCVLEGKKSFFFIFSQGKSDPL